MKQTKENLIIELTKIRQSHEEWVAGDLKRRKEFAKAFEWVKNVQMLGYSHVEKEPQLPSWEQIFVQVGKLLVLEELKKKIIPIDFHFPSSFPFNPPK